MSRKQISRCLGSGLFKNKKVLWGEDKVRERSLWTFRRSPSWPGLFKDPGFLLPVAIVSIKRQKLNSVVEKVVSDLSRGSLPLCCSASY